MWAVAHVVLFRPSPRLFYGWRNMVLRVFGATIGSRVQIYPSAKIKFPWMLTIEDRVVVSWDVDIYNLGQITIGSDTVISQHVHLCGGTHDYLSPQFTLLRTGLTVGRNVWIAADAFIGPGITVSDNSIVAARAVVVSNVEQGTLVAGNPARVLKKIDKPVRQAQ
jgi:putative colanic acid biosynthesis acetyltransferase WcaF